MKNEQRIDFKCPIPKRAYEHYPAQIQSSHDRSIDIAAISPHLFHDLFRPDPLRLEVQRWVFSEIAHCTSSDAPSGISGLGLGSSQRTRKWLERRDGSKLQLGCCLKALL